MIPLDLDLPDFKDPPVGEVVLSVQFPKIVGFQAAHFGRFWDVLGMAYPVTETHPPLSPLLERFDSPASPPKISVQFRELPPIPRAWFVNEDGTHLIQIQSDRFTFNWRKVRPTDKYPRYEYVRSQFDSAWRTFVEFLHVQGLQGAAPDVTQCEIGYINHIAPSGMWSNYRDAPKVLALLSGEPQLADCLTQESTSLKTAYVIRTSKSEGEAPVGRLHIDFDPGIQTATGTPIFIMHLLARGLLRNTDGNPFAFLDLGRTIIVNSFKRISTSEMHKVWGIQ